jgi:hypothetical protein
MIRTSQFLCGTGLMLMPRLHTDGPLPFFSSFLGKAQCHLMSMARGLLRWRREKGEEEKGR